MTDEVKYYLTTDLEVPIAKFESDTSSGRGKLHFMFSPEVASGDLTVAFTQERFQGAELTPELFEVAEAHFPGAGSLAMFNGIWELSAHTFFEMVAAATAAPGIAYRGRSSDSSIIEAIWVKQTVLASSPGQRPAAVGTVPACRLTMNITDGPVVLGALTEEQATTLVRMSHGRHVTRNGATAGEWEDYQEAMDWKKRATGK